MRPEARKYLWDALEAAQKIARFAAGKTYENYRTDELLRSAVERQFEIVGEALGQLYRIDADTAAEIPELSRIIAFRNILIHRYANVDDKLVWDVVAAKLDGLMELLNALLGHD